MVASVLAVAGLLFVTSALTARGTQLRSDRSDAVGLIREQSARMEQRARDVALLRKRVDASMDIFAPADSVAQRVKEETDDLAPVTGLRAVWGPGLTVTLDDAPRRSGLPAGTRPDDLVVHQQDVQAVVNALWAGGAEALRLMDQRVISTSAVRCVGNTLILQGRVYSPPYRITAIGPVARMRLALSNSPDVALYQEYVRQLGLGWSEETHSRVDLPAFDGSLQLRYAQVGPERNTVSRSRNRAS
ncbi:MAG: hypothetical protein QG608_3160 [Actinomycetota bacterium]|nr:hypothetical protein [Actinomycetota bacterium]